MENEKVKGEIVTANILAIHQKENSIFQKISNNPRLWTATK